MSCWDSVFSDMSSSNWICVNRVIYGLISEIQKAVFLPWQQAIHSNALAAETSKAK